VWVSVVGDDAVYRLSEDDLSVQQAVPAGPDPERISFGGGRLWIANTAAKTVSLLEPRSGARQALGARAEPTTALYHDGLVRTGAPTPSASGAASASRRRRTSRSPPPRSGACSNGCSRPTARAGRTCWTSSAPPPTTQGRRSTSPGSASTARRCGSHSPSPQAT